MEEAARARVRWAWAKFKELSPIRARVRWAWAKFKELSPIRTARGTSYRIKGKIYRACVQSVLTYGTENWAMKFANLQSGEDRTDDGEMDMLKDKKK